MSKLIIIGLGGFIGALVRYGLSGFVQAQSKNITFPFGTLAINLLGCLLIGAFAQLIETQVSFSADTRDFIFIGLLGAFTTFSTFSNETFSLMQRGDMLLAFGNIGMHLIFGLGAVWLGRLTMAQFIT